MNFGAWRALAGLLMVGTVAVSPGQVGTETAQWRSVPVGPLGFITGMVIHPRVPAYKYVRTDVGGAYRWVAGTQSWQPITDRLIRDDPNFTIGIESLAVDPANPTRVFVAAGDIYRSDNAGQTWRALGLRKPDGNRVAMGPNEDWRQSGERLAIDPSQSGATIYFGSRRDGLWRSKDAGVTWAKVTGLPSDGNPGAGITFVVVDSRNLLQSQPSQIIYAGVAGTGVVQSTNGGASWRVMPGDPGTAKIPLRGALDSTGRLYVTSNQGPSWTGASGAITRYTGGVGQDVTPAGFSAYGWCGISVDPTDDRRIVAGVWNFANRHGEVIFTTTNGAASWAPSPAVFNQPSWYVSWGPQNWTSSVLIDPENPSRTWKSDGFVVFATDNNRAATQSFSPRSDGIEELVAQHVRKIPGLRSPLVYGVADKVGFTLTDLTRYPTSKWTPGVFGNGTSLDYCATLPLNVARVAVGNEGQSLAGTSADGGRNWTLFPAWPSGTLAYGGVASSATDPQRYIIATGGNPGRIYTTVNRGASWQLSANAPAAHYFSSVFCYQVPLASDRVKGAQAYLFSLDRQFWRTTDGGQIWTKVSDGVLPWEWQVVIKAAPGRADDVWCGFGSQPGSLWRSRNAGTTWAQIARVDRVAGYGFGKAAPGRIGPTVFLSGSVDRRGQGVYRSDDLMESTGDGRSATWALIDSSTSPVPPSAWSAVEGDPDTYGKVYIGTGGRGLFVGERPAAQSLGVPDPTRKRELELDPAKRNP